MKMQELRVIAKNHGVNSFGKRKSQLIREVQRSEGNFDCFGSATNFCDQWGCSFRSLCLNDNRVKRKKETRF